MKDLVDCCNCGKEKIKVECGEDVCPYCKFKGALKWSYPDDTNMQEVED